MFKSIVLFLHRWLGIISGLVVLIVSLTGCIFCFQDEIQDAVRPWRKVAVQQKPHIEPSALTHMALAAYPNATAGYIYYFGKDRPAAVLANIPHQQLTFIYLNPYTGQLLHTEGLMQNFFTVVEYIHLYLLLPAKAGQLVVGISTIIFVVLMLTGIVLWWPKRKTDRKRSFTIKWKGRWKRVNYDLHNVLGFYSLAVALILAVTGLSMTFQWVNRGIYQTFNLGKNHERENVIPQSGAWGSSPLATRMPAIDRAFLSAERMSPGAGMFLIANATTKKDAIGVTAYAQSLHYGHSDFYYFDQYSGKLLKSLPYRQKSTGMKVNDLNYDLHVGQALGLSGKIVAFLASLICASLPVTGLVIWLGKKKKHKSSPVKSVIHRRTQHKQRLLF